MSFHTLQPEADWRDIAILLLTFPELKCQVGPVRERLDASDAAPAAIAAWNEIVAETIVADEDDEGSDG